MDKTYYKKRREHRISGCSNCRIGLPIGICDKNNKPLLSGDKISYGGVACIILWNMTYSEWWAMILNSKWYGDNLYNADSYGKGYKLPMDNGARMEIEKAQIG